MRPKVRSTQQEVRKVPLLSAESKGRRSRGHHRRSTCRSKLSPVTVCMLRTLICTATRTLRRYLALQTNRHQVPVSCKGGLQRSRRLSFLAKRLKPQHQPPPLLPLPVRWVIPPRAFL